jgi:hypothetical protein
MNDLNRYAHVLEDITPWKGKVPAGFIVDFLGTVTSKDFLVWGANPAFVDGAEFSVPLPKLSDGENGEFWFEAASWVLAAREARGRFVMITLGALFGYQAVGACRALQLLNPMPYKLVAVEPVPEQIEWIKRHMRDNGIDPDDRWVINAAISDRNDPVYFPVGAPGSGAQNCIASNEQIARRHYFDEIVKNGHVEAALESLLLDNTTGLSRDLIPGTNFAAEIKLVSTVTLEDLLGPLDRVDLLESDIQQSEMIVYPPFRHLLKRKVHRLHIGTHGRDVHRMLHQMFAEDGWDIVFSFEPESTHETDLGTFETNDGVLSVLNPGV